MSPSTPRIRRVPSDQNSSSLGLGEELLGPLQFGLAFELVADVPGDADPARDLVVVAGGLQPRLAGRLGPVLATDGD
jgi:hypothetical protein